MALLPLVNGRQRMHRLFLGSIEAYMVNSIRSCSTAKEIWEYLRHFQLEFDMSDLLYFNCNLKLEYN